MSPLHGVLRPRPFSDMDHPIDVIQVAQDCVCDQPRSLVECTSGSKTALFHLVYQSNWVHMKVFVIVFHMRYSSLLSDQTWVCDN